MNPEEKQKIQREAKDLMRKFAKSLEQIKFKEEKIKKPVQGFREESHPQITDESFRKQMLANAPNKNKGFIIAEKKKW